MRYTVLQYTCNERGSVLIGTFFVLVIGAVIGFAFLSTASYESDAVHHQFRETVAFWKAEEALSRAIALKRDQRVGFENPLRLDGSVGQTVEGGEELCNGRHSLPSATIVGTELWGASFYKDNPEDTVQKLTAKLKPASASDWFMLFDRMGLPYFIDGDTIDGPVHSNQGIKRAGSPVFTDIVECAWPQMRGDIEYTRYPGNPVFHKGLEWESASFVFDQFDALIRNHADLRFSLPDRAFRIRFEGTKMYVSHRPENRSLPYTTPQEYSIEKVDGIYFDSDVEVYGTLDGEVTIGSRRNIIIVDDLVYDGSDSRTGKPGNTGSRLGLIAKKNVNVNKDLTGSQMDDGIRINAAIIAMDTSFQTTNFLDGKFGTMHLWGSITERVRGINAISKNRHIRYGYQKNWHYDRRFKNNPPPLFPPIKTSSGRIKYTVESWSRKY